MVYISSYRLGDLYFLGLSKNKKDMILKEHPNSIGAQYILSNEKKNNIEKISKLVIQKIDKFREIFPVDISISTLIHLRLGDVISGNENHEKLKRPLSLKYYKKNINENEKIYIIGVPFFASTSSKNYEECINKSNEYLEEIKINLNAEHIKYNDADLDLCCAVLSNKFIQGRGYFSKLILEIRKYMKKYNNIETECIIK